MDPVSPHRVAIVESFVLSNLSFDTTVDDIKRFLKVDKTHGSASQYVQVSMAVDKKGKSQGIAFMSVPLSMKSDIMTFDGKELNGRKIVISEEKSNHHLSKYKHWSSESPGVIKSRMIRPEVLTKTAKLAANYKMVDCGASLTNRKFNKDIDLVITRAMTAGVRKIVITSNSVQSSEEALKLCSGYKAMLVCTVGVHPNSVQRWSDESEDELAKLAKERKCKAIGVCGLDYSLDYSPQEKQKEVFEIQVKLACSMKKPLVLHECKAHADFVSILEKYKSQLPPCSIHGFTGTRKEAQKYVEMGFYFGLTGSMLNQSEEDASSITGLLKDKLIPLRSILMSSDSPYQPVKSPIALKDRTFLSTESFNSINACEPSRNEPMVLSAVLETIAKFHMEACDLRKGPNDVAEDLRMNSISFYSLEKKDQQQSRMFYMQNRKTGLLFLSVLVLFVAIFFLNIRIVE